MRPDLDKRCQDLAVKVCWQLKYINAQIRLLQLDPQDSIYFH